LADPTADPIGGKYENKYWHFKFVSRRHNIERAWPSGSRKRRSPSRPKCAERTIRAPRAECPESSELAGNNPAGRFEARPIAARLGSRNQSFLDNDQFTLLRNEEQ